VAGRAAAVVVALMLTSASAHGQSAMGAVGLALERLPASNGSPGAIGLSAAGRRIVALEPRSPMAPTERRLLLVGGLDGSPESTAAVLDVLRWRAANRMPATARRRWQIAAVPCVLPDHCDPAAGTVSGAPPARVAFPPAGGYFDAPDGREARYLWRWTAMLGPDLVIDVRDGSTLEWRANALAEDRVAGARSADPDSLAGALGTGAPSGLAPVAALQLSGPRAEVVRILQAFLQPLPAGDRSPLREALSARAARAPLDIARVLAARYPANPTMSYIPALSWIGARKVSAITGDPQYAARARAQMQPFLDGTKPAIAEPYLLTSLAGHQAFFELDDPAALALARTAADFILDGASPEDIVRFATRWTDDMFMASSVLARAAARTADPRYADAAGRLLTTYAKRLQREGGVFIHADTGPHAWGRGNGFAAFGLMEALTHLPDGAPYLPTVERIFERHMAALKGNQASDGAWHQVLDEPGTYREFTATAMIVAAMARGLRLGWLDNSYQPAVERGWAALKARISESGELVDVCTGTGAGQNATREYYLHRPAIFGADDRGGAMALTAALEMHALSTRR
jgi:unsaturated rhamnogalacturonyl hydrolase